MFGSLYVCKGKQAHIISANDKYCIYQQLIYKNITQGLASFFQHPCLFGFLCGQVKCFGLICVYLILPVFDNQ